MRRRCPACQAVSALLAWTSIACALVLVLVLVSFTLRNVLALLAVVVGMAIAGAGSWWLVTERPPRRWFGLAGAVAGLAIVLGAVVGVATDADRPLLRVAIVVILFVVMVGTARAAVVHRLHAMDDESTACPPGSESSRAPLQPMVRRRQGRQVRPRRNWPTSSASRR